LNLNCVNNAKSGASNDYILRSVLDNLNKFNHNDLIIVMLTWPDRRLLMDHNKNKIVNALPQNKYYKDYYLKYHSEELGILNFLQNFLALKTILNNLNYYITFTTIEPMILCRKYNWAKNIKLIDKRVIQPPNLGFYSFIKDNKRLHPNDFEHSKIANVINNNINK